MTIKGQIVGYVRVSSIDQNLARQLEQLKHENVDKVFEDKASGATTKRPAFQQMLDYVREGDTIVVCSMDRLARNLSDLLSITTELHAKGINIKFLKENILLDASGTEHAMTRLLMSMLGAVAEFERSLIRERQREGIELAKNAVHTKEENQLTLQSSKKLDQKFSKEFHSLKWHASSKYLTQLCIVISKATNIQINKSTLCLWH